MGAQLSSCMNSLYQFVSQVLPPSAENACSHFATTLAPLGFNAFSHFAETCAGVGFSVQVNRTENGHPVLGVASLEQAHIAVELCRPPEVR